jgi:hypothetical protein
MIGMVHEAKTVNTGWKDRKTNMEIKKSYAVVKYNKFMKGIDRSDQYLSYYSVLRKTVKWSKKVVLYLLNCALFNVFFVYWTLNIQSKKAKYKNFPHEIGRSWISEVQNRSESSPDDLQLPEEQTSRGLNRTHQADSLGISYYTNLKKCLLMGREKRSILQDSVKCVLHIRSEAKVHTFVNSVLFCFTNSLVL